MYKKELDNFLQNNNIFSAIMLYGVDDFLISIYGKKISNSLGGDKLTMYYDEYKFIVAKEFLEQQSLFSENNILVIKTEKKIPKKEIDTLVLLSIKNKHCSLIVEFYEDVNDERKSQIAAKECARSFSRKKGVDNCRFFKLNSYESLAVLKDIVKINKINISDHALNHLLVLQNYDLGLCSGELNKLSLLEHEITNKDIDMLSFSLSHTTNQQLLENFF